MRQPSARAGVFLAVVTACTVVSIGGANASPPAEEQPPAVPATTDIDATSLYLDPVPADWADAASRLTQDYDGDPNFGGVQVDDARTELSVNWFSDPPAQLAADLAEISSTGVPIQVESAPFRPGDLRDAAALLLGTSVDGQLVVGAGPSPDNDGIDIAVDGDAPQQRSPLPPVDSPFPIRVVDETTAEPATRQADSYHVGGARIYRSPGPGACTTAFAVRNGTAQGLLTAAHCGGVGTDWIRGSTTNQAYSYGTTNAVNWDYDAALMGSSFSQGYVYIGTWNNANGSVYAISGSVVPFQGGEICYQGSYSGQKCGNVIQSSDWNYTISVDGVQHAVNGVRTQQVNNEPAIGNGDSGGPGMMIVNNAGTLQARAATIISAMPGGTSSTTCQGVAGFGPSPSEGRWCSAQAFSTPVWRVEQWSGWTIITA